jgi:hypothetical protein
MTVLLGLTRDRVLVIPGNHDINRAACESYFLDCRADELTPKEPYWPKFRHYTGFFQRYYSGHPNLRFTEEEPWTLFELPDLKVVVAGLNSTIHESHRDEDHHGWVGERQLVWFAERLRPYKERGWMRIGLVHHNVMRRAKEDEENLRDADDLGRILGQDLNLLLHGHTHQGRIDWLGQRLPVLSTGSASVALSARPQEVPNQYQVIRISPDQLWYGTRQYAPDQKRWIGDTRSSVTGNTWFHEERVLFTHVESTFGQRSSQEVASKDHLARIVDSYRSHLTVSFRRQPLHDLCTQAEDQDIPGGLALLDIFVPQAVMLAPPPKDLPRDMASDEPGEEAQGDEDTGSNASWGESPPIPVEQVLLAPDKPWVFLMGAPGAGKTSLTRWLCLKLCTPGEALSSLSSELVPVRVEMRRFEEFYRARSPSHSCDFYDYLDHEHAERSLALRGEPLRKLGESGRLMWLFDGIDEVADPNARRRYAEMIVGLSQAERSRGVITSRIVGAQPVLPSFQGAGVTVCTLLDFDELRIREFINRWHEKAFPSDPNGASARRMRLERAIKENRSIRELCSNPLLLTLIALLNRGGELPRRRHELYHRAIALMAAQWEANKQLPTTSEFRFEQEDKLEFLRELAWRMLDLPDGSRNLIHEEELLAFTSSFLVERQGKTPEQARRYADLLIGHLRERNYILARIGERLFGFVHKTFLEYLVADSIRSRFASGQINQEGLEDFFQQLWDDDSWHEVLTLICGMIERDGPENVLRVLQSLLPRIPVFADNELRFAGFAIRCMAEVRQLDREPIRTFMQKLALFAQHGMSRVAFTQNHDAVANTLHLIGPRWPARESWLRWKRLGLRLTGARLLANWCSLGALPPEEHEALLHEFLRDERNITVAHHTLARADLPRERIHSLLVEGDEGLRCAVAGGLLHQPAGVSLYQGTFSAVALTVLKTLLAHSWNASVRIRAAVALAEFAPEPQARDALLACVRDPSSPLQDLTDSIQAVGSLARSEPQIIGELQLLFTRPQGEGSIAVGLAVADAQIRASQPLAAVESTLGFIAQIKRHETRKNVEERWITCANREPRVEELLRRLCTEGQTETVRMMATRACTEVSLRRELRRFVDAPLSALLAEMEAPTTPERLRARLSRRFLVVALTEEDCERVLEVLRKMAAFGSSEESRLTAAEVVWALAFGLENVSALQDEACAVYRELAHSGTEEKVRLRAARLLGEEGHPTIESLASSSADEEIRFLAGVAQGSLKFRAGLQSVGRETAGGEPLPG